MASKLTADVVSSLKAQHDGGIVKVTFKAVPGQDFAVRAPTAAEYRRCMDKAAEGEAKRVRAVEALGIGCCVFPSVDEVADLCDRFPGIALKLGGHALELAGLDDSDVEKLLPSSVPRSTTTWRQRSVSWRFGTGVRAVRHSSARCSSPSSSASIASESRSSYEQRAVRLLAPR